MRFLEQVHLFEAIEEKRDERKNEPENVRESNSFPGLLVLS
jgi:hypothetical protein